MSKTNNAPGRIPSQSIDDGLLFAALDMVGEPPGTRLTAREIADYCGCSHQYIAEIERTALAKLRASLDERDVEGWRELFASMAPMAHENDGFIWRHNLEMRAACDVFLRKRGLDGGSTWGEWAA